MNFKFIVICIKELYYKVMYILEFCLFLKYEFVCKILVLNKVVYILNFKLLINCCIGYGLYVFYIDIDYK